MWWKKKIKPEKDAPGPEGIVAWAEKNVKPVDFDKPIDWNELEKMLDDIYKKSEKIRKANEKMVRHNIKHLNKRSKKLGKPIPLELLFVAGSNPPMYVGTEFYNKYREWF